ncbi:nucleoside phosphorylase [Candidatus Woesearchaeota archaeon]|nr:nucleoside phosphorylase [Candidatus Woesearchaeota archaeon]
MKTIFNFGDPHKDFTPIADAVLKEYKIEHIPITNNRLFYNEDLQIVDAAYGSGPVLDSLTMMKNMGKLEEGDEVLFLGSMGSLSKDIKLEEYVVPSELYCAHFGNEGKILVPDKALLGRLEKALKDSNVSAKRYNHGSVMAVFDPTTDHENYTNSMYDESVTGIDCSESYLGMKFCKENGFIGAVLLYCSDDPENHIGNISKEEFDKRALERDKWMNIIARETLLGL